MVAFPVSGGSWNREKTHGFEPLPHSYWHVHHALLTLPEGPFSLNEEAHLGGFMSAIGHQAMEMRQCAFCGKRIAAHLRQCPFCREMVPQVRLSRSLSGAGRQHVRRGLLYMLLAGVIYYFAAGYAKPLEIPVTIQPAVINYLAPLLFLGGLGLALYGFLLKAKS